MKSFFSFFLSIAIVTGASAASSSIAIESLGRLSLQFATPQIVPAIPSPAVAGEVTYLPGNGYQLILPFRVLQQQYLVAPQSLVDANTPLVKLSGSEVHHFYEMLNAQKEIYSQAEQRYKQNLPLFKNKSINQQSWQSITDHYFTTKLELGHLLHAEELLQTTGEEDTAYLISPVAGVFLPAGEQLDSEAFVYGEVIETNAMRLKVRVPSSVASRVTGLAVGDCQLPVAYRERLNNGLVSQLWSSSLTASSECSLAYGEAVMVTPVIEASGLSLPASSVYFFEDRYFTLVKQGAMLTPVAVEVLGRHGGQLLIAENPAISHTQVLTSSVSAVQGILLGLGGE